MYAPDDEEPSRRADIAVKFVLGSQTFVLDLAFVFPGALSYLAKGSARVQYAASIEMERKEKATYQRVMSGQRGVVFVPFVVETSSCHGALSTVSI